jgi:hypothetical protein
MHRSTGRIAALLGAGALALAAVSPVAAAGDAMVRVLHASPDAPAVDVFASDGEILSNVPFGAISDYLAVPGGTYNIKVCVANDATTDPSAETCVIDADLTFNAGTKSTVAATDLVAQIKPQVIEDAPANDAENAQVRVVHFSADTPPVDVLTEDGGDLGINGLAFPTATGYLALPAGTYDLKVCVSGSDPLACPDPVNPEPLPLAAGTAYTVFAIGSLEGGEGIAPIQLKPVVDATFEAAAPAEPGVTTPPTSTIAPATEGGSSSGSMLAILGILGVAGLATVGLSRRFATRHVEK